MFSAPRWGRKYRGSFSQWIDRGGAPDLVIEQADIKTIGNKWRLTLWLRQTGIMRYALKVPVAIKTEAGIYHRNIRLIGYPLRSRDVNMLGWRTRHPIPKAGSTTRAP